MDLVVQEFKMEISDINVGICLIIKNENQYLDEWLEHYRKLGVDKFFIYDNNSSTPIKIDDNDVDVILWDNELFGSQNNAYLDCCQKNLSFDFIGFFDTDEFYFSKSMNIKSDINHFKSLYGDFDGFAIYWRLYGKQSPYFTERQSIEMYTQYYEDAHIKSLLNPKKVVSFGQPHFASLLNGKYIDELGRIVFSPIGEHTSDYVWIKHIWTRSEEEFKEKLIRGDVNWRKQINTNFDEFYNYNDRCVLND
jgi:hypothetical protein